MNAEENIAEVRRTVARFHRAAGVPVVFGGPVTDGKVLRLCELFGTMTDSLSGLVVHLGRGLGGRTLALARPAAVSDYQQATMISHDYDRPVRDEGVQAAIAVPVVVRRVVRAVLYGARREAVPLGDRAINAAVAAAKDLEQELVVHDEVNRRIALLNHHHNMGVPSRRQDSAAWETVREAHAELRVLAAQTADEQIRERIQQACRALSRASEPGTGASIVTLAPREVDVLTCVALGHTNAEIGSELGLLPETVKSYLRSAMRKLDSHTRMHAVVAARQAGIIP